MKAAPDPNAIIADQMKQATGLMGERKYAEAVAVYQDLLAKYPQAYQLQLSLARAYHAEQKYDEEIAALKAFLVKEPDNVQVSLLAGSEMIAVGDANEGKALLASIDESKIEDPAVFLNVGISLLNQNKPDDAMTFFEKTISRFPDYAEAYLLSRHHPAADGHEAGGQRAGGRQGRGPEEDRGRQGRPDEVRGNGAGSARSAGRQEDARATEVAL